jgi:hypothetical protein
VRWVHKLGFYNSVATVSLWPRWVGWQHCSKHYIMSSERKFCKWYQPAPCLWEVIPFASDLLLSGSHTCDNTITP